jgi:predicted transcriptional regulator
MERILAESPSDIQKLIEQENVDIRLFRENDYIPSLIIGDDFTYFCFFNKSHMYDHRDIISFTEGSIDWGTQLFVYCRDLSVPVSSEMLSEIINGSE